MKNRTFGYASIQTFFWMCYASVMGFASMYLLNAGFDNSRVGILIAAAGVPIAAPSTPKPAPGMVMTMPKISTSRVENIGCAEVR